MASLLRPWRAFGTNHNFVVGTLRGRSSRPMSDDERDWSRFDVGAVSALGDALRAVGYDNTFAGGPLARLALGFTVCTDDFPTPLAARVVAGLTTGGLAVQVGSGVRLRGAVLAAGPILAYRPRQATHSDAVYLGIDSAFLVDAVGHLAEWSRGQRGVDLGTGTGVVAAALAMSHRVVVPPMSRPGQLERPWSQPPSTGFPLSIA